MFTGGLASIFFQDTTPVFNKTECLNRLNRFSPCNLCEKICYKNALRINSGGIFINEKICDSCGLCVSICPSEALKLKDYQVLRTITGNLELKCMKSGGLYCLRALKPALLAAIIVIKPDIKFVMPCENCEVIKKFCDNNLLIAMKFLDDLNFQHDIKIINNENFESTLSRRDLLTSFFNLGRQKSNNIIENLIWNNKNDVFLARKFLFDRFSNNKQEVEANIFFDFAVSEGCNACGLCQAMCPSGAWKISRANQNSELKFSITECSGCMLCVNNCPEKAILPLKKFSLRTKTSVKKIFHLNRCRHCGKFFIKKYPEQELCYSCSGGKKNI